MPFSGAAIEEIGTLRVFLGEVIGWTHLCELCWLRSLMCFELEFLNL